MRTKGLVLAGLCLLAVACASAPPEPKVPPEMAGIAEIHRVRCAHCHVLVKPGARTRAALEIAFVRHRKRVHMLEPDWALMVDYLAAPEPP